MNAVTSLGETPLHCLDAMDQDGYCPIHVAALAGRTAAIKVFLQHDIGMLSLRAENGYTALHCAARRGQAEVVEFICSNYPRAVDVNAVTSLGETPLHVAAIYKAGKVEVIKALCRFGAEVAQPDYSGDNALHFAVLRDDEEKAKALLSANAKLVDMAGASGETPLHWAVRGVQKSGGTSEPSKMIDILCNHSNNVSIGDQYGNTPLHFAASYTRDDNVVQQLLGKKANPEKRNSEGLTPLDFAASKDARHCFVAMYKEAQNAYHIDNVFYDMHRVHEYIKYHQMDKAGKLMSSSLSNAQ